MHFPLKSRPPRLLAALLLATGLCLPSLTPAEAARGRAATAQKKGSPAQKKGPKPPKQAAAQPSAGVDEGTRLAREAGELERQKKFDEAIAVAEQSLAVRERDLSPNDPMIPATLRMIADLYVKKKAFDRAVPLRERAVALIEKYKGADSFEAAFALEELGTACLSANDPQRALKYFERALKVWEKRKGVESDDVGRGILHMGQAFAADGDFEKAEAAYLKSAALFAQAYNNENHPQVANALRHLGRLYRGKGQYAKAADAFEKTAEKLAKFWKEPNDFVLNAMMELGGTYAQMGNLQAAETLFMKVAEIDKQRDPDSLRRAAALLATALVADEQGDFGRAEPLYDDALDIFQRQLAPDDVDLARARLGLGNHYLMKGALDEAKPLIAGAAEVWEKTYGPDDVEMATPLSVTAELHRRTGDYARAEALLVRVVAIDEKKRGADHPITASDRVKLGKVVEARGDSARAAKLYEQALAAHERTVGKDHPAVAESLLGLAELRRRNGDVAGAERAYNRARDIYKATLGGDHLHVAEVLDGLAALYVTQKKPDQAVATQAEASDIYEHNVWLVLASGSEAQKRQFLSTLQSSTDFAVNLHLGVAPKSGAAERLALTTILQRKGRVLDVMADTLASLRKRMSESDRALLEKLAAARGRLALAVLRGPGEQPVSAHKEEIAKMEAEVRKFESRLGAQSRALMLQEAPVTIERVQAAIPDDARLVEYFVYRPRLSADEASDAKWGPPRYAAYTLTSSGKTGAVDLGPIADVDPLVQKLRRSLSNPDSTDFKDVGRKLDEKIMRPVRPLIGNTKKLLLSPDGLLNVVPFAALVDEKGRFLVDGLELTYLTSGRDLLRLQQAPAKPRSSPLIVANPAFGRASSDQRDPSAPGAAARSSTPLRGAVFTPLPGTAKEGKALRSILSAEKAELMVDTDATEDLLKRVQAPKILHIATHGFFLADDKGRSASGSRGLSLEASPPPAATGAGSPSEPPAAPASAAPPPPLFVENPLLRSGLALAGANGRKSGDNDGILTAFEAASLDLRGTKLVVLSACETGLGDVQNGDGVYGMRRALVIAGAETQVASLWKVADDETRELMVSYYDKLEKGGGRSSSLRDVQLAMMSRPATSHPYYWASFLVAGEAAPIPPDSGTENSQKRPPGALAPGSNGCACELGAGTSRAPAHLAIVAIGVAAIAMRSRSRRKGVTPRLTKRP